MRIIPTALILVLLAGFGFGEKASKPPEKMALWQRQMAAWIQKGLNSGRSKKDLQKAGMVATNAILNMTWQDTAVAEEHLEAAYRQLAGGPVPAKPKRKFPTVFRNGSYEVGVDIQPGRYRSAGPKEGMFPMCQFARLRTAGAGLMQVDEIIDLQISNSGQALVTIRASDGGFFSQGCKAWVLRK